MNCLITPYNMAFPSTDSIRVQNFDLAIDILFMIDIIINFFSAYLNEDFDLIDDLNVKILTQEL